MRKILTLIFIGILLLFNINFIRGSYQSYEKLSEINKEDSIVTKLEETNKDLKEELQNRDSIYFIEQEARNRLGYTKPGETTIVIESSEIAKAGEESQKEQKSNLESWFELVTN